MQPIARVVVRGHGDRAFGQHESRVTLSLRLPPAPASVLVLNTTAGNTLAGDVAVVRRSGAVSALSSATYAMTVALTANTARSDPPAPDTFFGRPVHLYRFAAAPASTPSGSGVFVS